MMYLLITLLVVAVVMLFVYLAALKNESFAKGVGFLCALFANTFVLIEHYLDQAGDYWQKACIESLNSGVAIQYWVGIDVLSRLVYFVLGLCILTGETIQSWAVMSSVWGTVNHVALPGIVELTSAALFICCPALFGAIILECWGKIRGVGLFHDMGNWSRWIVGVISFVLLLFTILVNYYFYEYRAIYLADPQAAQGMVVYILGGLGIEVSAVSPFALLALVVGGAGVLSVFLWVASAVCKIISSLSSLLPSTCDVLGIRVCGMSVYQQFRKPVDCSLPVVFFRNFGEKGGALQTDYALQQDGVKVEEEVTKEPPKLLPAPQKEKPSPKKEKGSISREFTIKFERKVEPKLSEQSSEQPKDTSQTDTVKMTNVRAKRKPTTRTRKVKVTAAPSLNGRKKTTTTK